MQLNTMSFFSTRLQKGIQVPYIDNKGNNDTISVMAQKLWN